MTDWVNATCQGAYDAGWRAPEESADICEERGRPVASIKAMTDLLDEAKGIVGGSRNAAYGNPADNHNRTAAMWSAFLGIPITARQVCYMNILQKCSREAHWSQHDNDVDCAGYAANAAACKDTQDCK